MFSAKKSKHFYNRAAFGDMPSPGFVCETQGAPSLVQTFTCGSKNKPIQVLTVPERDYEGRPNETEIKAAIRKNKEAQIKLNTAWFTQLTDPQAIFREKMTFFWHDHFACRTRNAFLAQQQMNTIRAHAFGKFGDLLMAVSKDPAMLQFLNNQQNKKDSPNENFARELMELFTLGRGNYSEEDIKNAARAFTGWAFNPQTGAYLFRQRQHDFGSKTFRGKTGNFSGEDIVKMILEDKQTARFITTKICNFFVGEGVENSIIAALAKNFYQSDYDIQQLIMEIYSSEWFYEEKFIGNRIKSPIELIAGIQVHTGGTFNNPLNMVFLQKALGQVLLQPPNVGGWPSGKEWIDSSSLTFRMSLPTLLMRNAESTFQAKDDGDTNDATNGAAKPGQISFSINWENWRRSFQGPTPLLEALEYFLLAKPTTEENRKMISAFAGTSQDEVDFMKKACIGFMSLPEYQLN
jgi:uncharacterized protein (DUF1800 family)